MKKLLRKSAVVFLAMIMFVMSMSVNAFAANQNMYRLYNLSTGEHFYTANATEKEFLCNQGWRYEGVGWVAPGKNSKPVYRVYNKNAGDHHYTLDKGERDMLVRLGWKYEGIGWYSDPSKRVPLYRAYNPNAKAGSHNYTTNYDEQKMLTRVGWKNEGIAWYGVGKGSLLPARSYKVAINTSRSDYTTVKKSISKYSTVYIHYQVIGGDSQHKEDYTCKAYCPDGDTVKNTTKGCAGSGFTQQVSWDRPYYAPSGNLHAWLEESNGRKAIEAYVYWG